MFKLLKTKTDLPQLKVLANKLAYNAKMGDLFLLKGELGAGKTTFARFFINSIYKKNSLSKPDSIKSPSFPIMINYSLPNFEIFHYDLYRLKNKNEIVELNFFENIKNNLTLIEWPEIFFEEKELEKYFLVKMKIVNEINRDIEITHTHIKDFF